MHKTHENYTSPSNKACLEMGCAALEPTCKTVPHEDSEAKAVTSCHNRQNIRMEGLTMANNKQMYITSTTFFSCCPV